MRKKMQDQLWAARAAGVQGSKGGKAQGSQKSRWGGGIGRWVESEVPLVTVNPDRLPRVQILIT